MNYYNLIAQLYKIKSDNPETIIQLKRVIDVDKYARSINKTLVVECLNGWLILGKQSTGINMKWCGVSMTGYESKPCISNALLYTAEKIPVLIKHKEQTILLTTANLLANNII